MAGLILNADVEKGKISRHIYGHFAEHLGRCIYDGIWVGEDSPIPNVRGIRSDIVDALRAMGIPNLRWPGGCFADEYHWMDGIGPKEGRPTMVNTHWGGVTENNHFGTHEFMDLCDQLGCEPYICGNVGSGTVQEMQQWVEYISFDGISPMADMRRANGRDEAWEIPFWGVGNENWGCGGSMRPEYYADEYRRYQTYVRNFGTNRITKIACGASDDDYRWTEVLMRNTMRGNRHLMDGLALHYYTGLRGESATEFDERGWFQVLKKALGMEEMVARHSAIMDQYDPSGRVGLVVDEWGTWYQVEPGTNPGFLYQQNSLRDALVAGLTLNIFNAHCGRVQMANIAQTINVLQAMVLTRGEQMLLTPTYHVFEMYRAHQDSALLSVDLESDMYAFEGAWIPRLSVSASVDCAGRVHLTVCNTDPNQATELSCEIRGLKAREAHGRVLTAEQMTAHNTFDEPSRVHPKVFAGATLNAGLLQLALPAKSVVAIEIT